MLVLLGVVVYSGATGGMRAGLASAGIAVAYYAGFLLVTQVFLRYAEEDIGRVVIVGVALPSVGVVVGWLRERIEHALGRERRARDRKSVV